MISYLVGEPLVFDEQLIIKTASGVGYRVYVGPKMFGQILNAINSGQKIIELFIYSHIREDRFELYGVAGAGELKIMELLLSVSGLGPKIATVMLDAGGQAVIQAIQQADLGFFITLPRVGKKLAQKIIIELKNKVGGLAELDLAPKSQNYQDVAAGLTSLGFGENQIEMVLREFGNEIETKSTAEILKIAIQKLNQN